MENNEKQKNIEESILATIKSGQLRMRPKWHFVLKASLVILGAVIIFLSVLYLASFIIFVLRQTGVLFMPAFGWEGWFAFFNHLPVFLISLVIIFIVVLELLVRHYAFAYRRPLLYSALGIFVLAVCGAVALANSSFHSGVSNYADDNRESAVGRLYAEYGRQSFVDVHRGMIIEMANNGFVMQDRREEFLTIVVTRRTRLPFGADFSNGDIVVVFGSRNNSFVQAAGIQKLCGAQEACE